MQIKLYTGKSQVICTNSYEIFAQKIGYVTNGLYCNKADILPADRSIDIPTLLGPNNELSQPVRQAIRDAVFNCICLTEVCFKHFVT